MNDYITGTEFDRAVERVLDRPEYAHLRIGVQDLIERIREAIIQWIRDFLQVGFSNLPQASSVPKSIATIFY